MKIQYLELGGGEHRKNYYTSIDLKKFDDKTIVHDLETGLKFIDDECVGRIYADNVLEHITNFIQLMNECYRVAKLGCIFEIVVPLFPYTSAIKDPTHVRFFVEDSFDYFDCNWDYEKQPNYRIKKWRVLSKKFEGEGKYQYLRVRLEKIREAE